MRLPWTPKVYKAAAWNTQVPAPLRGPSPGEGVGTSGAVALKGTGLVATSLLWVVMLFRVLQSGSTGDNALNRRDVSGYTDV